MKRTFGKSLVFFILIVLFTLCAAVGCTTLNVAPIDDQVTDVTNANSTVTMELSRSVLLQGGEVELTITAKMKNDNDSSRIWGSAEFWIASTYGQYISVLDWSVNSSTDEVEIGNVGGAFESKYDIKLDEVGSENANGFLHFYLASNNSSKKVSSSVPLIIKIKMKYAEDAPAQDPGTKMAFTLNRADYNFIADYTYNGEGSTQVGVRYTADPADANRLVVDDSKCYVELREATDDSFLEALWVNEGGIPTQSNHTSITVLNGDTAEQQVSYTATKASKNTFFIQPFTRQEGARVKVYLGDKRNELSTYIDDNEVVHEGVYKATLNGDGTNGITRIIISVISEAQLDNSTVTVPTEFDYTLTVTQTYCGLDNIKVTTNENSRLDISEDKKGIDPNFPSEDKPTTYKVLVPVGKSNGLNGATKVNITPSVLTGYGISNSIAVSANSYCTATSTNIQSGGNFDVENLSEGAEITLRIANSQGSTTQITIEFELISINTDVVGDIKLTYGDNKELFASNVGGNFTFKLPKSSEKEIDGTYVRVGDLSATLSDGATFVIKQNDVEIDKVGEGDDAKYQLKAGDYELLVTSAAGNTQSYAIHVENESVPGEIVRFEYRLGDGEWLPVFDLNGVVDTTGKEFKYDANTKTFTLNGAIDLQNVYFRFAITDDSTLIGFYDTNGNPVKDNEITGEGKYGTYRTFHYVYNNLTTGINRKTITVNSDKSAGNNTYTLEVIKTEQNYDILGINIGKDGNDNPLIDFSKFVDNGEGTNTMEYPDTINVPFATSAITLIVNAQGHSTQVFVNGKMLYRQSIANTPNGITQSEHSDEIQLRDGRTTTLTITHKGTDGLVTDNTKTYVFNITRLSASSDATLAELEIYLNAENADDPDAKLNLPFTPDNDYYRIPLPTDTAVNKVFIKATANESHAKVSGSIGYINLDTISTDTYRFNIVVTPENSVNGSGKMIYTIEIYAPTSDLETYNTLKEFQIIGNDNINYLTGDNQFEEANKDYSITVPYNVNKFNLVAVAKGNFAKISVTMNDTTLSKDSLFNINVGNNTLKVTVTPQNEQLQVPAVYTVRIIREESRGSAELNNLQVNTSTGINLMPGIFNKDRYDYEITVNSGNQTDNLDISIAIPTGAIVSVTCNNDIISGDRNIYNIGFIDYGTSKTYLIKVTLDNSEKTYTLKINREFKTPSLDTLVITQNEETIGLPLFDEDGKDEISYEKGVYEYTVKISYENVSKLVITTTAQSNVIDGTKSYIVDIATLFGDAAGTRPYEFKISSGGITQQYTIYITRLANPASNANIKNITISRIPEFAFSSDVSNYGPYTIDNSKDILQPKVECEDENATSQIFVNGVLADNNLVNLAIGDNNIRIVVTAADRVTTKEVFIKVVRKHPSISSVTVTDGNSTAIETGVTINDDINAYSFTVGKDIDKIDLNLGLASGYTQTITSGDPNNLKVGEFNKITIEVKDSNNNVVRTIEFNVFRENPADYTMWFIIAGVLGAIILILLILTIVAFTKGGKGKKKGNISDIGIGDYELD